MRAALLRNLSLYSRYRCFTNKPVSVSSILKNNDCITGGYLIDRMTLNAPLADILSPSTKRFFSSGNGSQDSEESKDESEANAEQSLVNKEERVDVEDVSNKELKGQIEDYLHNFNNDALPMIFESILKRGISQKHQETDDELMNELRLQPIDDVKDEDFISDFEDAYETDEDIEHLYNARDIAMNRMTENNEYFNMDDTKWNEMIKEAVEHGYLQDTKECEEILEDMLHWDKLLPVEIKIKVEKKFNEIAEMIAEGEIVVEEGYALFKEFEDKMVVECAKLMEAEAPQFDDIVPDDGKEPDDPPGEGPILRWRTRVVFAPGGDAWHPKNRKVKLAVTVKELGLSKHQFIRLRELVGKRYNPGKDELTITSERFEHREENRKDCLRTLFALIEEAGEATKLVEDARTADVKERLKANAKLMQRLHEKTQLSQPDVLPA